MKNAAVNATTAIADGVSSLLGGSKVKRLEAENENLRQDIAYRPDRTQKEEVGKLVKKNYRKKPSGAARLSANDIITRHKLKAYQDGYALAMAKYGLKRGIVGSEARHTTTAQYYRDLLNQTEDIQENIGLLLAEKERAESELAKIKSEARTEQLKTRLRMP